MKSALKRYRMRSYYDLTRIKSMIVHCGFFRKDCGYNNLVIFIIVAQSSTMYVSGILRIAKTMLPVF